MRIFPFYYLKHTALALIGVVVAVPLVFAGDDHWAEDYYQRHLERQAAKMQTPGEEYSFDPEDEIDELRMEIAKLRSTVEKKQDKPLESKKFVNKLGGIIIVDSLAVNQSGENKAFYGDVNNDLALREARFQLKGTGYDVLSYECSVAVSAINNAKTGLVYKNIMVGVKDVPIFQKVKVGHFKVETCMSERDLLINSPGISYFSGNTMSFSPHRRLGIGSTMHFADQNIRWYNGVYASKALTDEPALVTDNPGVILDTRLTATPIYRENEDGYLEEVLHIGGSSYWLVASGEQTVKLRARPTVWTGSMPYLLTGVVPIENSFNVSEGEIAYQRGRFGFVSENFVGSYGDCGTAWASTLIGRCFLTKGNIRHYSKEGGGFAGAHLVNNIGKSKENKGPLPDNWGDLELVVMYAHTNMDNLKNVEGSTYGTFDEGVLGVNWWWTPDLRWSTTWTHGLTKATKDEKHTDSEYDTLGLQMSVQY